MFILISVVPSISSNVSRLSAGNILYVGGNGPGNYSEIQSAINSSSSGDTVYVYEGIYRENLLINKTLFLIGESKNTTIIDGGKRTNVVTILSDSVKLSNFTIQNSSDVIRDGWWKAGIRILNSNITVEDNIIKSNLLGIFAKRVENLIIRNNLFYNDSVAIYPYDDDFDPRPSLKRTHFTHRIENNLVNDKPLLYFVDESDLVVSSDVGQLILVNCTNVSLKNTVIYSADFPILLVFCNQCIIENTSFFDNDGECTLLDSDENTICYNQFYDNFHGLLLDYGSESNYISHNRFFNNRFCGVICEYFSNQNMISQNDFVQNKVANAFLLRSFKNIWDDNYWSDWIGLQTPIFQVFPKIIFGTLFESYQSIPSIVNIDSNPRGEPFFSHD